MPIKAVYLNITHSAMRKILYTLLLLNCFITASANHFTGGYIRYEYTGTGLDYKVYLYLYKTCESGAIDLPTFTGISISSANNSININRNIPLVNIDTLDIYCKGNTNSCQNISAPLPGYIAGTYSDIVTLPKVANDWKFIQSNSNRTTGIENLQNASTQSFYIDALLDLSKGNNTSAFMPDPPPNILLLNDTAKIPLTAYDKNGHTVSYKLVQPVSSAGMTIPYYSGYSLSKPFGTNGVCYIDGDNNLVMMCDKTGKYTLALEVTEKFNNSIISTSLRDFVITCINNTNNSSITVPQPDDRDLMVTYTCPGKSNNLKIDFSDPNPQDSVYITIAPPTLSGWTFNTNTTALKSKGTAVISWTTPSSLNPATLPFFNIEVIVRDNSCPKPASATYIYNVLTRSCYADSVWPGDANSDKRADLYDALAIAMNYSDTGATRINASNTWTGQLCDPWSGSFLNNIDIKHADCNGDGIVDTADLSVISINYNKTHPKGTTSSRNKITAGPDLFFTHTGINAYPDSIVTLNIHLGDASGQAVGLYGLATNITINGITLINPPEITYNTTWLGNSSNTLHFEHSLSNNSTEWAYSRNNKQHVSGQGIIAQLTFTIPSTAKGGDLVKLSFDRTKMINAEGNEITEYNTQEDSFYIRFPVSVSTSKYSVNDLYIYPNPGNSNKLNVAFYSEKKGNVVIEICDVTGKVIDKSITAMALGSNIITQDISDLDKGIYFIRATDIETSNQKAVKYIRL